MSHSRQLIVCYLFLALVRNVAGSNTSLYVGAASLTGFKHDGDYTPVSIVLLDRNSVVDQDGYVQSWSAYFQYPPQYTKPQVSFQIWRSDLFAYDYANWNEPTPVPNEDGIEMSLVSEKHVPDSLIDGDTGVMNITVNSSKELVNVSYGDVIAVMVKGPNFIPYKILNNCEYFSGVGNIYKYNVPETEAIQIGDVRTFTKYSPAANTCRQYAITVSIRLGIVYLYAEQYQKELSSPGFPNPYPPYHAQEWEIWPANYDIVTVYVHKTNLDPPDANGNCHGSYLHLEGAKYTEGSWVKVICGVTEDLQFSSNYILVKLLTLTNPGGLNGFILSYHMDSSGSGSGSGSGGYCEYQYAYEDYGSSFPDSSTSQATPIDNVILSPGFPHQLYPPNTELCYHITSGVGNWQVALEFQYFDLEYTSNCHADRFEIFDTDMNSLHFFCGSTVDEYYPHEVIYEGLSTFTTVKFHSDNDIEGQGFKVRYIVKPSTTDVQCTKLTASKTPQILRSQGYPYSYQDNTNQCWVITSASYLQNIVVVMEKIKIEYGANCEYDFLRFIDGFDPNGRVLDTLCGSYGSSHTVTSSGPNLYLYFRSDTTVSEGGFSLQYHTDQTSGCTKIESYSYSLPLEFPPPSDYRPPTTSISGKRHLCWQVSALEYQYPQTRLYIRINKLSMVGDCANNYLSIRDGEHDSAPSLLHMCPGDATPRQLNSTGKTLYIELVTADTAASIKLDHHYRYIIRPPPPGLGKNYAHLAKWVVVLIIIVSLLVLVFVIIIPIIVCYFMKKRKNNPNPAFNFEVQMTRDGAQITETGGATGVTNPPPYSQDPTETISNNGPPADMATDNPYQIYDNSALKEEK